MRNYFETNIQMSYQNVVTFNWPGRFIQTYITLPLTENICEQFEHDIFLVDLLSMLLLSGKPPFVLLPWDASIKLYNTQIRYEHHHDTSKPPQMTTEFNTKSVIRKSTATLRRLSMPLQTKRDHLEKYFKRPQDN